MLTFKNIQDKVMRMLDVEGDTGHQLDLVKDAINSVHALRLSEERWSFMLWPTPISLTFQTAKRNYTLHELAQPNMIVDFTNDTAKQVMHETPSRARYKSGVQEDRFHFEFVHNSPVKVPFAVGKLTVTGGVSITYVDNNGNVVTETVANGAQTSASVVDVTDVSKTSDNVVTLVDTAALNILSLSVGEFAKIYPQIRLFDDGRTETGLYRFYRRPRLLVNDNDIPNVPFPYSNVLIYDTLLELYTYNDDNPPQYWLDRQQKWDTQLRQAYQEGESEGSESRQVQEVDTYGG